MGEPLTRIFSLKRIVFISLFYVSQAYANINCSELKIDDAMLNPPESAVVIGKGRLQFHSSPHEDCMLSNVFVISKDQVTIYSMTIDDKWSKTMFVNSKTGVITSGWVLSNRLKITGQIRPKN